MAFGEFNGIVLHVEDVGPRDAPVLAFSNSLGTDFRIWDAVIAALGGGFRTVRYDKRGHGLSAAPPAPYRMAEHVADLAALLDRLGAKPAVIVGLSVGGMIAQGLAAARPDLVRGLVLCDTAPRIGNSALWDGRIAAVAEDGIEAIADGVLERWFSRKFRAAETAALAGYRHMLTRTPVAGYAGTCAAIRDADLTEAASAIAVPTLCVVGDEDGSTPPDLVRALAETVPGARFEIIAGAGHLPCVDRPADLAGLIHDFTREAGLA